MIKICPICKKEITIGSKSGLCHSCAIRRAWQIGKYSKRKGLGNRCIDCDSHISPVATRCGSCAQTYRHKDTKKDIKHCDRCNKILSSGCKSGLCRRHVQLGRILPKEWKENIKKGQPINPFKGHHHTEETKLKMRKPHPSIMGDKNPNFGKLKGRDSPRFGKTASHGIGSYYKNIWMRSSYEIKFAKYLDNQNIKWQYEPKTFDLGNTTYTPDFYLPENDTYIEIKGWWRDDAKTKFEEFKQKYCGERIKIIDKKELQYIGVL